MCDEYTDVSNKQQLSMCVRWIDDSLNPHEDFLGFYELPNIASYTIAFDPFQPSTVSLERPNL